jgi:6-pyruvoyltetrahydropterin/6-carboxytetrahydropterin synthase
MYTISKTFSACCSHVLTKVPPGHPCGRLHGHNYEFELVLQAPSLDERGFVTDYRDLDLFKRWIDEKLDHRHLNDALPKAIGAAVYAEPPYDFEPTAENLAKALFDHVADPEQGFAGGQYLVAVRVRETPKTCAEYRP